MADQDSGFDLQKQLHSYLTARRASLSPTPPPVPEKPPEKQDVKTAVSSYLTKTRQQIAPPPPKPALQPGQRVPFVPIPYDYPEGIQPGVKTWFEAHPEIRSSQMGQDMLENYAQQAKTAKDDPQFGANSWWLRAANRVMVKPFDDLSAIVDKGLERNKAFKENARLAGYQYFDKQRGQQVSI